jgi:hypothetical protein
LLNINEIATISILQQKINTKQGLSVPSSLQKKTFINVSSLAYRACSLGKKTRLKVSFVDLLLEKKYC